jgi:hypothetical protein
MKKTITPHKFVLVFAFLALNLIQALAQGPTITFSSSVNCSCYGSCNGSATSSVSGGTAPYTYTWSPIGGSSATANSLCAGTYSLTVHDATGYPTTNSITISQPQADSVSVNHTDASCFAGNNGTASVSVMFGGTPPFTYSWSPVGGTNSNASGLLANTYTCTITDSKGCPKKTVISVGQASNMVNAPSQNNNVCYGATYGSATANISGGTPAYSYSWNPNTSTSNVANNLTAGTYTLHVTDANGCISNYVYTITQPAAITAAVAQTNVSCYGLSDGKATLTPSGGTGTYMYSWTGQASSTGTITNVVAGTYTCSITDMNYCNTSIPVFITQPAILNTNLTGVNATCHGCDGSITSATSGGTAPYTYSWSPGTAVTSNLTALCPATYSCNLKDAHGCTTFASKNISQSTPPIITGTVTSPISGPINSGKVYLVNYDALPKKQKIVDSVAINNGKYTFNSGHMGFNFFVYAIPSIAQYPNTDKTYSPHVSEWDSATVVLAPCATQDTANIKVYDLPPTSGLGFLGGQVTQSAGYVPRWAGNNPGVLIPGDPVPGLDVNLEQHPGGVIAHTTTDMGGNYHFSNVPAGMYTVLVDIPGLSMTGEYTRTIVNNQSFTKLDYRADSSHIRPDTASAAGIFLLPSTALQILLSPNPFRDQLSIQCTLPAAGDVEVEIFNTLGERVYNKMKNHADAGLNYWTLDASDTHLPQGIYMLSLSYGGDRYIQRIVSLH